MAHDDMTELDEKGRAEQLRSLFRETFGGEPDFVARAPGRINLIGEHTDYNGGFVLPATIDRTLLVAARAMPGSREVDVLSVDYGNRDSFSLDAIERTNSEKLSWSNYVRGVAWALGREHLDLASLPGAQLAIEGNVPLGSGLSSSAAIAVATALTFTRIGKVTLSGVAIALVSQKAENEFVGVKSGIMDQFISALGQTDSALLIDTRSLTYRTVPLGFDAMGYKLVAVDSAVPRALAATAYNQRRDECEQAVRLLAPYLDLGRGAQLRDITSEQLTANAARLPETLLSRARHVISENERVLETVALMDAGLQRNSNMARFGELLYASHVSLRDDYEVSSKELDLLVDLARNIPGVAGARMTGAGFGGCTVNIVKTEYLGDFRRQVVDRYHQDTGRDADIFVCTVVEGGSYLP